MALKAAEWGQDLGVDVVCSPLPVQELVLGALAKPRVVLMVPPHLGPGAAHTYLYEGDFSSYSCSYKSAAAFLLI